MDQRIEREKERDKSLQHDPHNKIINFDGLYEMEILYLDSFTMIKTRP